MSNRGKLAPYQLAHGLGEKMRRLYFRERSPLRQKELEALLRDAEYLHLEMQRLERRAGLYGLTSVAFRDFLIQLYYWEDRPNYPSDKALFDKFSERFFIVHQQVRQVVFNESLQETFWFMEDEGGEELDYYIPPDQVKEIPQSVRVHEKVLASSSRKDLFKLIHRQSAIIARLNQTIYNSGRSTPTTIPDPIIPDENKA